MRKGAQNLPTPRLRAIKTTVRREPLTERGAQIHLEWAKHAYILAQQKLKYTERSRQKLRIGEKIAEVKNAKAQLEQAEIGLLIAGADNDRAKANRLELVVQEHEMTKALLTRRVENVTELKVSPEVRQYFRAKRDAEGFKL